jgi:hypothetical protein
MSFYDLGAESYPGVEPATGTFAGLGNLIQTTAKAYSDILLARNQIGAQLELTGGNVAVSPAASVVSPAQTQLLKVAGWVLLGLAAFGIYKVAK